jgi:hypothetical protein
VDCLQTGHFLFKPIVDLWDLDVQQQVKVEPVQILLLADLVLLELTLVHTEHPTEAAAAFQ